MKTFVVADTHFNHANIIKYCNRPFKDTKEMNEVIIQRWNEVINKDDIVYHLGDFGFGSLEELKEIFDRLNGRKYLILGNHDLRYGKNFFLKLGFIEVNKKEMKLDNISLTHYPKEVSDNQINVYGHIHDKPVSKEFDDTKHYCISLEKTNYYPVQLEKMIK